MKKLNLVGKVYGRLTVIEEAERQIQPSGQKPRRWKCQCECGNETIVLQAALRSGRTKSCGCLQKESIPPQYIKHNKSRAKEYKAWMSIKQRCINPNDKGYSYCGGRGITMAPEWVDDFQAFYDHVGPASHPKASLNRIDNNGNYEPGNVQWITNKSIPKVKQRIPKNNTSGCQGVYWDKHNKKWLARLSINKKSRYLGSFSNFNDAVAARKAAEEQYHEPLLS